jgi:hypothetical protein
MRNRAFALLATTALVAGGQLLSSAIVERQARTSLHAALAAGGAVERLDVRHAALGGRLEVSATVRNGETVTTLERLALPAPAGPLALVLPAQAQSAFTVASLARRTGDGGELSARDLSVEGAAMPQAALEALFDANAATPLADRMRRIGASRITVREIVHAETRPMMAQTTTYRDVELRDIRDGRIGEAVARSGTQRIEAKADRPASGRRAAGANSFDATFGEIRMSSVDLPLIVRFMTEAAAPGEMPAVAAARSSIRDYVVSLEGGRVTVASISTGETRLRPLKTPFPVFIAEMEAMAKEKDQDKNLPRMLSALSDMFGAFSLGEFRADGIRMELKDDRQRPVTVAVAASVYNTDASGRHGFDMRGIDMSVPDGSVRIGEIGFAGASFRSMIDALTRSGGDVTTLIGMNPREFVPEIGKVRLAGIDIDVKENGRGRNGRVKAAVGAFELQMANHQAGIPADITMDLRDLSFAIPADTREEGLRNLRALGYDSLAMSFRFQQAWDAAAQKLSLKELSLDAPRMIRTNWSLALDNVSKEVFDKDTAVQAVAALAVNARTLTARVENLGLIDKLIEQQAKQQRRRPEDVRREMGAGAAMAIPLFLGDHPAAKTLADAVARFAAQPKSLDVAVTAKGAGLSAADFVAMTDPQSLLSKVDITAAANR